jgi:hypothetical protein
MGFMRCRVSVLLAVAFSFALAAADTGRAIVRAAPPNYAPQLVGLTVIFHWSAVPGLAETPCGMVGRAVISTQNSRGPITATTTHSPHGWHVSTSESMSMSLNWRGRAVGSPTRTGPLAGGFAIKKAHAPLIATGFASGLNATCPVRPPRQIAGQPAATFGIRLPLSLNYRYVGQVCAYVHVAGGPSKFRETVRFAKALPFYGSGPRTKPCV